MRVELQNEELCRYLRVYHYYRNLILSGQMKSETKLPSIRKGASELQMSRTTMENAYMLLAAEGYIVSRPQSGYYVTDIAEKQEEGRKKEQTFHNSQIPKGCRGISKNSQKQNR